MSEICYHLFMELEDYIMCEHCGHTIKEQNMGETECPDCGESFTIDINDNCECPACGNMFFPYDESEEL